MANSWEQTASGKSLATGGFYHGWFAQRSSSASSSSSYVFSGQLHQYNMFADVLSAAAIRKIVDGGLCFDLDELSKTRVLRWEDIRRKKSRSGSVKDIDTCCKQLLETQVSLADAIGRLNETDTELRMTKEQFETLTGQFESLTGQLNRTEDKLETGAAQLNRSQD